MKKECEAASWWWTYQLNIMVSPTLQNDNLVVFQRELCKLMELKYKNHWYMDDPERGHAFRSIMYDDGIVDSLLVTAAQKASITNLKHRLPCEVIMWCDPSSVKVQYSHTTPRKLHVVYEAQAGARSPTKVASPTSGGSCRTNTLTSESMEASLLIATGGDIKNHHSVDIEIEKAEKH